ncbi:DUF6973 domain-containing protein [Paenibacillus sp. NRS-1782]|uniref:DUF6973 domain-containing protein n=1 Tax=unclassified Paenibacillus TaxID=185978 RepID=UPI003D2CF746
MKKGIAIISLLASVSMVTPIYATASSVNQVGQQEGVTSNEVSSNKEISFENFLTDELYKDLPKDMEAISFYQSIEEFKKENPSLSNEQVVQHFDDLNKFTVSYDETYEIWTSLTPSEKALTVSSPVNAALTKSARDKAYQYTKNNYGRSGSGDVSDAFRHAVWNALMCKYISKDWAQAMATAHEDKDAAYFSKVFPDGFTGRQHTNMDLHNNQKGRDCWNVLTDSQFFVSDGDLQNRVIAKIRAGEMVILR